MRRRRHSAIESWDRRFVAADAITTRAPSSPPMPRLLCRPIGGTALVDDKSGVVCSGRWEIARGNFGRALSAANAPSGLLVLSIQWLS